MSVPVAVTQFEPIVAAGIAAGLNRAVAEARAREILFGGAEQEDVAFLNDLDEAMWQSCVPLTVEDAWMQLKECEKCIRTVYEAISLVKTHKRYGNRGDGCSF